MEQDVSVHAGVVGALIPHRERKEERKEGRKEGRKERRKEEGGVIRNAVGGEYNVREIGETTVGVCMRVQEPVSFPIVRSRAFEFTNLRAPSTRAQNPSSCRLLPNRSSTPA